MALWCSDPFTAYDDLMFHCEYRVKSRDTAYVCICGSRKDYGSLEEFLLACKERKPAYDREKGRLRAGNEEITYRKYDPVYLKTEDQYSDACRFFLYRHRNTDLLSELFFLLFFFCDSRWQPESYP